MSADQPAINWAPLLRSTLLHHDPNTDPTTIQPMDPERKQWLNEAMNSVALNHVKRLQTLLNTAHRNAAKDEQQHVQPQSTADSDTINDDFAAATQAATSNTIESTDRQRLEALEEIDEIICNIDDANDLVTLGGLPILHDIIADGLKGMQCNNSTDLDSAITAAALQCTATALDNNPKAQEAVYQNDNTLELIISAVNYATSSPTEVTSWKVCNKAMLALSAYLRSADGQQEQLRKFIDQHNGIKLLSSVLLAALPTPSDDASLKQYKTSTTRKTLSLLKKLWHLDDTIKDHPSIVTDLLPAIIPLMIHPDSEVRMLAIQLLAEYPVKVDAQALQQGIVPVDYMVEKRLEILKHYRKPINDALSVLKNKTTESKRKEGDNDEDRTLELKVLSRLSNVVNTDKSSVPWLVHHMKETGEVHLFPDQTML